MRPRALWLGGLLAVLTATFVLPLPRGAAPKTKYADKIAEAERLAQEDSMALARDAFAEALQLAPDAEARRWCELWLTYATWRADEEPDDWDVREQWKERDEATFTALLKKAGAVAGAEGKNRPRRKSTPSSSLDIGNDRQ